MHTLKHALLLRPGEWTEPEATRVRKIIDQAVEAISNDRSAEQDPNQGPGERKP
jgi:hypothetical protein